MATVLAFAAVEPGDAFDQSRRQCPWRHPVTRYPRSAPARVARRVAAVLRAARHGDPPAPAVIPFFPPGHYHSALVDPTEVAARLPDLVGADPTDVPGVDLRLVEQRALLAHFSAWAGDWRPGADPGPAGRYGWRNDWYPGADALVLHCLLRHLRPARVIEVGSGWSTAAALDTIDAYLTDAPPAITCVEPDPGRLSSLLRPGDLDRLELVVGRFQDVAAERLASLADGDVLLVDSTHVLKAGSDVHYLLFDVLPSLAPGVVVHLHDVHAGFEYPEQWLREGWSWNEAYAVRAFLQYNDAWEVLLQTGLFATAFAGEVADWFPGVDFGPASSLWIRRRAPVR